MKEDKVIKYLIPRENYNPSLKGNNIGVIHDVETTGIEKDDEIIQYGALVFTFTDDLEICEVKKKIMMYNDPKKEISDIAQRMTGITKEMIEGHSLKKDIIAGLIARAEINIAHNASFDRYYIEKGTGAKDATWACSMFDINYREKLINSRNLDYLAFRHGFWYDSHGVEGDTSATLEILSQEYNGKTLFKEMMENVYNNGFNVIAVGVPFNDKDILKSHGFKWNPDRKIWSKDVDSEVENFIESVKTEISSGEFEVIEKDITQRYKK